MPRDSHASENRDRRRGLRRRTLFVAAGAVGAAGLAARPLRARTPPRPARAAAGYRETEHVRTVYRLARF